MVIQKRLIASLITIVCFSLIECRKFQVCVVDGRGSFKKAARYCPVLDGPDSKVECVIGLDRLDCLRRISKGKADFTVLTPEDLVTATNTEIEVLITNEMRFTKDQFEYEVVAVVSNDSHINSRYDLKDKRLCHPGYGYETDWTRIIANYLEVSVVPPTCNRALTLTENRIFASSKFFKSACKAGPWVNEPSLDEELKRKYPNLCEICDSPTRCSTDDKYWGRRGPLFCLTDGSGDISWARLDDVQSHFNITPGSSVTTPDGYSLLCPDGRKIPVNSTHPCIWLAKPWPVIATKRTSAQDIQQLVATLTHDDNDSWQSAVLNLIETYHLDMENLDPVVAIEGYLEKATGYLSANSFPGCHPPRTIKMCTTSNLENSKCLWLREASAVYGVEPDVDCLKANSKRDCMQGVHNGSVDVVIVSPDLVNVARSGYNLTTLFYETVAEEDKYETLAIVKADSGIESFEDLGSHKACFPIYDGVAWNSVIHALNRRSLFQQCPFTNGIATFFGESCVPGLPENENSDLKEICKGDAYNGEYGAMRCLTNGDGEVAFVSRQTFSKFFKDPAENANIPRIANDYKILCDKNTQPCHLSWAPAGQAMVRDNSTDLWMKDTLDVFLQMDNLFGKKFKTLTSPFTMFGLFDGKSDILFHDATIKLRDLPTAKNSDKMLREYDAVLNSIGTCKSAATSVFTSVFSMLGFYISVLMCRIVFM